MRVYYNDNDAKAAAWLRELIRQGLLPDGEVDERSILEVDEVDLWGFDQHHFFAGIGGWPLALQLAGLEGVEGIFTGSPPCQPFSPAGKLQGKSDERHLAPKFIELVRSVRPRVLFGEQVASAAVFGKAAGSARSRAGKEPEWAWIDDISDRLEAAHYAVGTSDIPAAGVGAPHIRQRTFFGAVDGLADYEGSEREWIRKESDGEPNAGFKRMPTGGCGHTGGMADTSQKQHNWVRDSGERWWFEHPDGGISGGLADIFEPGLERYAGDGDRSGEPGRVEAGPDGSVAPEGGTSRVGHAASRSCGDKGEQCIWEYGLQPQNGGVIGEGYSGPWIGSYTGKHPGASDGPWGDVDWLFCRDGKWRPVIGTHEPVADGLPTRMVQGRNLFHPLTEGEEARTPRLKGYGNAIVPQAAAVFIESFMESLWWIR